MFACGITRQMVPERIATNPCTRSTDWKRSQTPSSSSGSWEITVTSPVTAGSMISVRWVISETCSQSARMSAERRFITNLPGSPATSCAGARGPCHDGGKDEAREGEGA